MKAIMALQVGDWAAHYATIDYDTTNVSQINNQDLCWGTKNTRAIMALQVGDWADVLSFSS